MLKDKREVGNHSLGKADFSRTLPWEESLTQVQAGRQRCSAQPVPSRGGKDIWEPTGTCSGQWVWPTLIRIESVVMGSCEVTLEQQCPEPKISWMPGTGG